MQLMHEIGNRDLVRHRIEIRAADVYGHQLFTMILPQVVLDLRSTDKSRKFSFCQGNNFKFMLSYQ